MIPSTDAQQGLFQAHKRTQCSTLTEGFIYLYSEGQSVRREGRVEMENLKYVCDNGYSKMADGLNWDVQMHKNLHQSGKLTFVLKSKLQII